MEPLQLFGAEPIQIRTLPTAGATHTDRGFLRNSADLNTVLVCRGLIIAGASLKLSATSLLWKRHYLPARRRQTSRERPASFAVTNNRTPCHPSGENQLYVGCPIAIAAVAIEPAKMKIDLRPTLSSSIQQRYKRGRIRTMACLILCVSQGDQSYPTLEHSKLDSPRHDPKETLKSTGFWSKAV